MLKLIQKWTLCIFIVYVLFLLTEMVHEDGQGITFKAMTSQKPKQSVTEIYFKLFI